MIGGERADHPWAVALLDDGGRERDGSHRIARARLREHVGCGEPRRLGEHGLGMRGAGDDHNVGRRPVLAARASPEGGSNRAQQIMQELWCSARERGHSRDPTPPAGTTATKPSMGDSVMVTTL